MMQCRLFSGYVIKPAHLGMLTTDNIAPADIPGDYLIVVMRRNTLRSQLPVFSGNPHHPG
jgi:hypothetical protein